MTRGHHKFHENNFIKMINLIIIVLIKYNLTFFLKLSKITNYFSNQT